MTYKVETTFYDQARESVSAELYGEDSKRRRRHKVISDESMLVKEDLEVLAAENNPANGQGVNEEELYQLCKPVRSSYDDGGNETASLIK